MPVNHALETYYRGVYGVFNDDLLIYVGSSSCGIAKLETNHRNARTKYGESGMTVFRESLEADGQLWTFNWLIKPTPCTAKEIETQEGQMIRMLKPKLNIDYNPVRSSENYGRY
jgi:hypothetical protein